MLADLFDRLATSSSQTRELEIGHVHEELRRVHLQAHLEQAAILTPERIAAYDALRGYTGAENSNAPLPHDHRH